MWEIPCSGHLVGNPLQWALGRKWAGSDESCSQWARSAWRTASWEIPAKKGQSQGSPSLAVDRNHTVIEFWVYGKYPNTQEDCKDKTEQRPARKDIALLEHDSVTKIELQDNSVKLKVKT